MTRETERRVIAFVRSFAQMCSTCLRRDNGDCAGCPSAWARRLMHEVAMDERPMPEIDYSFYTRTKKILAILNRSSRPMMASEINLRDLCSAQLKFWTLNQMVLNGTLGKEVAYVAKSRGRRKTYFRYYIKKRNQQ